MYFQGRFNQMVCQSATGGVCSIIQRYTRGLELHTANILQLYFRTILRDVKLVSHNLFLTRSVGWTK
jgi:hypothetical protein